ncbi:MAG: lysophospholipid acyltransferase family protein [Bacteroidia bacterium]|nr:lysophospholipid acyltransferase family protein [Bacteroidia bacterium]
MGAIIYFISLPLIYLISVLPFPILYLFSDFVWIILFGVFRYRRDVIRMNLRNSFPEKSSEEIEQLARRFEHYLCDLFLETFKTLTVRPTVMLKHCKISDHAAQLFDHYESQRRHTIIVMGHFGNWEWAGNTFSLTRKTQLYVIYHPLKNKWFDGLVYRMRTRFGTKLIPMRETLKYMLENKNGKTSATAFISDQTPHPDKAYWLRFMNQDTPVFMGTEKFARKLDYPVIYVSVNRIKRGHYVLDAELLSENPKETADYEITQKHTAKLESDILKIPEIWLWSHRRWKHKRAGSDINSESKAS